MPTAAALNVAKPTTLDETEPKKEPAGDGPFRVEFKDGAKCEVALSIIYQLLPEKVLYFHRNIGDFEKGSNMVKNQIKIKVRAYFERETELDVRENRERISAEIVKSLDYTVDDIGMKVHRVDIGEIYCSSEG